MPNWWKKIKEKKECEPTHQNATSFLFALTKLHLQTHKPRQQSNEVTHASKCYHFVSLRVIWIALLKSVVNRFHLTIEACPIDEKKSRIRKKEVSRHIKMRDHFSCLQNITTLCFFVLSELCRWSLLLTDSTWQLKHAQWMHKNQGKERMWAHTSKCDIISLCFNKARPANT